MFTQVVRPLRSGQITIPAKFREKLGIDQTTLLQVTLVADELRLRPIQVTKAAGSPWLQELYDIFAPVRTEAARYSEEEVDRDIDQAVAAVRGSRGKKKV